MASLTLPRSRSRLKLEFYEIAAVEVRFVKDFLDFRLLSGNEQGNYSLVPPNAHIWGKFLESCSRKRLDGPRAKWLDLLHRWGKIPGLLLVLKACLMGAVAKRFVCRLSAAAQDDCTASAQAVRLAFHIHEFKIPFYNEGTIVPDFDFCWRHLHSFLWARLSIYLNPAQRNRFAAPRSGSEFFI